jgi:hypothetical protein
MSIKRCRSTAVNFLLWIAKSKFIDLNQTEAIVITTARSWIAHFIQTWKYLK